MHFNSETKRKFRDMGADELLNAFENQNDTVCTGLTCEQRIQIAIDEAHSSYITKKVELLTKRAQLRYPDADIRSLDYSEERGLDRLLIAELSSCGFAERRDNVILQGYAGSGKTYLSCSLAKECCRKQMRSFYIRIPDLEEKCREAKEKVGTDRKLVAKLANYQILLLDEWILDSPSKEFRSFLLELMERRYKKSSTIFCTQFKQKDWHTRLGGGIQADALMERIIHNAIWVDMGEVNMRAKYCKQGPI